MFEHLSRLHHLVAPACALCVILCTVSWQGSNYNYGLDKMEQREDYDRELYFMFEIALSATIRVVKKTKAGKVIEKVRIKGAHTLKLARQVPIIKKMFEPVDVIESPWIVLEMSEFGEEDKAVKEM